MKANSLCSMRFHLLVPGGRWFRRDGDPQFIDQHLQFPLPQAHAVAIAAAAVGIDQKSLGRRIAGSAEHVPPAPYARHGFVSIRASKHEWHQVETERRSAMRPAEC